MENIRTILQQADYFFSGHDYKQANRVFEKALTIQPSSGRAVLGMALCNIKLNQSAEAIAILEKSLLEDVTNKEAVLVHLATLYEQRGEYNKSISYNEQILRDNPNHFSAIRSLLILESFHCPGLVNGMIFLDKTLQSDYELKWVDLILLGQACGRMNYIYFTKLLRNIKTESLIKLFSDYEINNTETSVVFSFFNERRSRTDEFLSLCAILMGRILSIDDFSYATPKFLTLILTLGNIDYSSLDIKDRPNSKKIQQLTYNLLDLHFSTFSVRQVIGIFSNKYSFCHNWLDKNIESLLENSTFSIQGRLNILIILYSFAEKYKNRNELFKSDIRNINKDSIYDKNVIEQSFKHLLLNINKTSKSEVIKDHKNLDIAVCISGQLRGYEEAFKSWKRLGIYEHNPTFFVDTWTNVGNKGLSRSHAHRNLPKPIDKVFSELCQEVGEPIIKSYYPSLFEYFEAKKSISLGDVRTFYSTNFVNIEDENSESHSNFSNTEKMHYKIFGCQKMLNNLNKKFDLVIRIRPDKWIGTDCQVNLSDIHKRVSSSNVIYTDSAPHFSIHNQLIIGDQLAIGTQSALNSYSNTWLSYLNEEQQTLTGPLRTLRPHESIGFQLFYEGYSPEILPGFKSTSLINSSMISIEKLLNLVDGDIQNRDRIPCDDVFLQEIQKAYHSLKANTKRSSVSE